MKYVEMIVAGRLPRWGSNGNIGQVNKDVVKFLMFFLPAGEKPTRSNLLKACRHLHLAFTSGISGGHLDLEEIYGILAAILIRIANQYDPHYTQKVKGVADVINEHFKNVSILHTTEIRRHLDFDCDRHCSLLCRPQFFVEAG